MTFNALLANLRHASTNRWKVNKNKNLIKFSRGLLLFFYLYYSSEETKVRSNWLFWKKWYALTIRVTYKSWTRSLKGWEPLHYTSKRLFRKLYYRTLPGGTSAFLKLGSDYNIRLWSLWTTLFITAISKQLFRLTSLIIKALNTVISKHIFSTCVRYC